MDFGLLILAYRPCFDPQPFCNVISIGLHSWSCQLPSCNLFTSHSDTVYPRAIPMDPPSPPQVPQGPMTRARARAFETEVTSLLALLPYESCETWLLPQASVLCVLRCEGDHFGEELEDGQVPKVVDEPMHREGQKRAPGPGHPAPWPGHPAPGHSPTEGQQQLRLQGPDIRPGPGHPK